MYQPIILFLALRYIFGKTINRFNRYVYWIFNIMIILSISVMIIILSVMNGLEYELKHNALYLTAHAIVIDKSGFSYIGNVPRFIPDVLNPIIYMKPLVISDVILQSSKKMVLSVMLGVNPIHFEPLFSYLINNNINQLVRDRYHIIISASIARQLMVDVGDQIRVTVPYVNQVTPLGYLPSQRLFTILDIYYSPNGFDEDQILIHQDDASKLMHYPYRCITGWRIWVHDPFKIDQLKLSEPENWIWEDWRKYRGGLFQAIKLEKIIMFVLFTLIIIVSGFNITAFIVLSIMERQKEIAILKTYGCSQLEVIFIFMIQGIIGGTISIIFGTTIGILFSKELNQILLFTNIFPKLFQLPVKVSYFQVFSIDFMIFILIMFAILYPSYRVASINPSLVLNYD